VEYTLQIANSKAKRNRLRDFGLYVVISMAVISIALCALELDVPWNSFMHWFGFAGFTLFLFGQFVIKSRWAWRKRSFWIWMSVFLIAHSFIFARLILNGKEIPVYMWIIIVVVEMAIFMLFRTSLYRRDSSKP
jgi:hypothetical protein